MKISIIHCEAVNIPPTDPRWSHRLDAGEVFINLDTARKFMLSVVRGKDEPNQDRTIHTLLHKFPGEEMWEVKDVLNETEVILWTPENLVYGGVIVCLNVYRNLDQCLGFQFRRTAGPEPVNQIVMDWITRETQD